MHASSRGTPVIIRFDVFEVDLSTRQLSKRNRRVKMQELPFRLLVALLEEPGAIVTREQLRTQLWGETVVDFDRGLHTAMRKLRDALGDSATRPRFIETIPRRGYRFLAPVTIAKTDEENVFEPDSTAPGSSTPPLPTLNANKRILLTSICAMAAVLVGYVVLVHNRNSQLATRSAEVVPLTSYRGLQRSPSLSPDGTHLAFTWDGGTGQNLDLYVQNIDGSNRMRLTSEHAPVLYPAWSPNGRTIAFVRDENLILIPAIGGTESKITTASGYGLSWSADSQTIAFADREMPGKPLAIFLISVKSGVRRRLTFPAVSKEIDCWPTISPQSGDIAFGRGSTTSTDVYRMPASGGVPTKVAMIGRPLRGIIWSPDGQRLLVATGRQPPGLVDLPANASNWSRLDRVDIAGSDVYELSAIAHGKDSEIDLAYSHETSDWDIWGREIAADRVSPSSLAASIRADQAPSFSPDGLRLVFNSDRSGYEEIWVSKADGSLPRQLTHFNSGLASSPRWSPDGKSIAFDATVDNNRDIYVIRAEGGSPLRVTHENSAEAQPSWSRNGEWLYFMSDRSGSQQIWRVPGAGGEPSQITQKGGYQAFESMDGKTVYYARERSGRGIWSVPVHGGAEVLVSAIPRQNLWSLSAGGIYYFDLTGLLPQAFESPHPIPVRKIDPTTNKSETVATIRTDLPEGAPAMDVRNDGKYLVWVGRREHRSELMLIRNPHLGSK